MKLCLEIAEIVIFFSSFAKSQDAYKGGISSRVTNKRVSNSKKTFIRQRLGCEKRVYLPRDIK